MERGAFTVPELMERWNCSKWTIYKMIDSKQIKAFRIGSQYRVPAEAVVNYENGN